MLHGICKRFRKDSLCTIFVGVGTQADNFKHKVSSRRWAQETRPLETPVPTSTLKHKISEQKMRSRATPTGNPNTDFSRIWFNPFGNCQSAVVIPPANGLPGSLVLVLCPAKPVDSHVTAQSCNHLLSRHQRSRAAAEGVPSTALSCHPSRALRTPEGAGSTSWEFGNQPEDPAPCLRGWG